MLVTYIYVSSDMRVKIRRFIVSDIVLEAVQTVIVILHRKDE